MTRERRFILWAAIVVVWAAAALLRLGGYDGRWLVATLVQTGVMVCLLGLLWTTPTNAIRLRGPVSWAILVFGVWLNLVCAVPIRNDAVVVAAVVLAGTVPVGVWSTVLRPGASAWWVALVGWSPALPALVARPVRGDPAGVIAVSCVLCLAGLAASVVLVWFLSRDRAGEGGPRGGEPGPGGWGRPAVILGIATVLSGIVPWLS
ncbi:MAG: hypothetical protein ACI89L_000655 [Phycisphaerales bacterium]|jgi:hypothetical protein